MPIRPANLQTATIVLLSVIALFFFPAPRGSFVSTHGPMTTVRQLCEGAMLRLGMFVAAAIVLNRRLTVALAAIGSWLRPSASESPGALELRGFSVLRI
jgi:hypothetical protein